MAATEAFDHVHDLYDTALKPRLLHSLLKDHLPDETRSFRNPSELSYIVSTVKTHQLLSENGSTPTWQAAVDAWVSRVQTLAASNMPDKCWAGVCLLGLTVTESSSDRFVASHVDWFNMLLSHISPSGASASQLAKVASCAAVSDLLTRLAGFSNQKKDGNSHAGKLVQPILKMFDEDDGEVALDVAAHLLSTILTYFPSSVHRHLQNAEGAIVVKLMYGNCSASISKKLACCLAMLPKSKGDEESWSLLMQKVLISVNGLLNEALGGLEEESRRDEALCLLVPPGKDPPPSLGSHTMSGKPATNEPRSQQSLTTIISSLIQCCCSMLTSPYPTQVSVPVRPLLVIIRRVLMVNGSLSETLKPFTTAMQQEFVCFQLPILHLCTLELLEAAVDGIRRQLFPYAAEIMRIILAYLKVCRLPKQRTKVYSVIRAMLLSLGCGMALYGAEDIILSGSVDLQNSDSGIEVSNELPNVEIPQPHRRKKRKHGGAMGPLSEQASFGLQVESPTECPASIALKVAALEALETLLIVGGALKSDSWRRKIDYLLVEVAINTCGRGWTYDESSFHVKESTATWEHFQFVALRALLASLISSAGVRPPYLAQGLELFYKGKQNSGTKVAEFCAQALLALEVFIHPRALPLVDGSLVNGSDYYSLRTDFGVPKYKLSFTDGKSRRGPHDVYDFLNDVYLDEPGVTSQKSNEDPALANKDVQVEANGDKVMVDVHHHDEEHSKTLEQPLRRLETFISNVDVPESLDSVSGSKAPVQIASDTAPATALESAIGQADKNILNPVVTVADDEDSDCFPEIRDDDQDTDSDSE